MKGLLRKDLHMLWSYYRLFLLMIPLFLAASYFQRDNFFFVIYPSVLVGILPVSIISYEERSKWNYYCQTLPIPRWQVVVEKYLLGGIGALIVTGLSMVVQFFIFRESTPFDVQGYLASIAFLIGFGFLSPALLLPVIFRLGTEKGRLAYYLLIGFACASGGLLASISSDWKLPRLSSLTLAAVSLVLFIGSCILSIHIYNKREL